MPSFKKLTRKNARSVLTNIADRIEADADDAEMYIDALTLMLDDLCGNDRFGTEGQLDPRGDHRD